MSPLELPGQSSLADTLTAARDDSCGHPMSRTGGQRICVALSYSGPGRVTAALRNKPEVTTSAFTAARLLRLLPGPRALAPPVHCPPGRQRPRHMPPTWGVPCLGSAPRASPSRALSHTALSRALPALLRAAASGWPLRDILGTLVTLNFYNK